LFFIRSEISELYEIKIRTNFTLNNNIDNYILNYLENELKNNENDKYEQFFNKYNLKQGQTFNDNENIKTSFDNIYRFNLVLIIFLIVIYFPLILIWICIFCNKLDIGAVVCMPIGFFVEIVRNIILIILLII